jgi:hypothetical protein
MAPRTNSPKDSLDTILPKLGPILQSLFEEGEQGERPIAIPYLKLLKDMPGNPDAQEAMLMGALAILRGMGLIQMDSQGRVRGVSRHACYALGSLSKFLKASAPATDEHTSKDDKERAYLLSLTEALESVREEKAQVSHEPLHARRIVNVLIKSRQVRHWRTQDVYLHVYHPQWKAYHLVGLSHKDDSKTDEEIAHLALQKQVGLMPDQYTLDPVFNPPEITARRISATSGALTEYTYRLLAVKEIRVKLKLKKLVEDKKFDRNWFRWFTWEEIKQRESDQGEPIMFSTPLVLGDVNCTAIPLSASEADDMRASVRIVKEFGNRFTYKQLVALATALVVFLLLQFVPYVLAWLGRPDPRLDNLSNIAQIIGTLIALAGVVAAFLKRE